jgi:hypothetical protein
VLHRRSDAHHPQLSLVVGSHFRSGWCSGLRRRSPMGPPAHPCRENGKVLGGSVQVSQGRHHRATEGRVLVSYLVQPQPLGVAFGKLFALPSERMRRVAEMPLLAWLRPLEFGIAPLYSAAAEP